MKAEEWAKRIVMEANLGGEPMERAQAEVEMLIGALKRSAEYADETDYCHFCDSHPSGGHSQACPVSLTGLGRYVA